MNTTIDTTPPIESPDSANGYQPHARDFGKPMTIDQSLTELRTGRRLEQVTTRIGSFLQSQIARIEESLAECEKSVNQNQIVQRIIADFEQQKADWESQRDAESKRLYEAGERLIAGWQQLEDERQKWMATRTNRKPAR